ncbi:uncharacterized protein LOC119721803 isoform X2 [Patiria miniata]|nr:uncharacterized protein LOC119721803 isoform X2 [Patiria miniata]
MAAGNQEQDNRTNTLTEEHMRSAIETVLGKTEQSYEDFMSCFTSLRKEDVVEHQAQQLQKMLRQQNDMAEGQRSHGVMNPIGDLKLIEHGSKKDDIETEELDEGHYAPTRQSADLPAGPRFVQMDNFVDDAELLEDDLDNDEEFASCRYESSFGIVDSSPASSALKLTRQLVERIEEDEGNDNKDEISQAHPEFGGGCEMRTLPGEAEEEEDGQGVLSLSDDAVHRTELEMSTRCPEAVATEDDPQSETRLEDSSDEVQPFSLDADFDYDNVALTPKWDSNHGPPGWKPGH